MFRTLYIRGSRGGGGGSGLPLLIIMLLLSLIFFKVNHCSSSSKQSGDNNKLFSFKNEDNSPSNIINLFPWSSSSSSSDNDMLSIDGSSSATNVDELISNILDLQRRHEDDADNHEDDILQEQEVANEQDPISKIQTNNNKRPLNRRSHNGGYSLDHQASNEELAGEIHRHQPQPQPHPHQQQPPNELIFSNQTGAIAHCGIAFELADSIAKAEAALGSGDVNQERQKATKSLDIQVRWERENGEDVESTLYATASNHQHQHQQQSFLPFYQQQQTDLSGLQSAPAESPSDQLQQQPTILRYVRPSDGALVFEPFRAAHFRPEIHATSYRCVASSASRSASLVSRDMQVKAFVVNPNKQHQLQIEVLDEMVIEGNSAQFKCQIPFHAQDYLQVLDWIEYPGENQLTFVGTTLANANQLLNNRHSSSINIRQRDENISGNISNLMMRYFLLPKSGNLHILNVDMSFNYRSYKCRCKNKLTGELVSSINRGKLIVTESNSPIAPRLVMETSKQVSLHEGELGLLSCNLQASPRAQLAWYRKLVEPLDGMGGLEPIELTTTMLPIKFSPSKGRRVGASDGQLKYAQVGGILLINRLHRNDSGLYVCQAKNSIGEERLEVELLVRAPLRARLSASASVLELGKSLALDCSVSGFPIHQVVFRHNQNIIKTISGGEATIQRHPASWQAGRYGQTGSYFVFDPNRPSIENNSSGLALEREQLLLATTQQQQNDDLNQLTSELANETKLSHVIVIVLEPQHAGAYQCFAYNQFESVQSSSYIRVLDDPPKFKETFRGEVYEQRQDISLQCSARANPLPEITWSIDGQQIPESSRIRFGDFVTKENLVISYVNISQTQVTDSGLYKCVADNGLAQISHQAQISILGPIQVKPMMNVTVVASTTFRISCPVAGYPISEIHWEHNQRRLPANHRQHVYENGTLEVEHMEKSQLDEGEYICIASGGGKPPNSITQNQRLLKVQPLQSAFGSVFVSIKVRPTIEPFAISRLLREGQRASIMCTISSGDLPISISWFKNNMPLSSAPGSGQNSNLNPESQLLALSGLPSSLMPPQVPNEPYSLARSGHNNNNNNNIDFDNNNSSLLHLAGLRISRVSDYSSTLLFESLSVHHSGNYTCLARNDAGSVSHQAPMIVQVAPKWSIEPSDTNIVRGSASSIDCMATGYPPPRIIWTKAASSAPSEQQQQQQQQKYVDGPKSNHLNSWQVNFEKTNHIVSLDHQRSIVSSPHLQVYENGSLNVLDARDSDAGHYMCQASNAVGPGLSKVIRVTINVAAQFNMRHSVQYVARGEQAHLKCQAKGDWPIAVHWFRNKNRLEPVNLQDGSSSSSSQNAGPAPVSGQSAIAQTNSAGSQQQQQSERQTIVLASILMLPASSFPQANTLSAITQQAQKLKSSVMDLLSSLLLSPASQTTPSSSSSSSSSSTSMSSPLQVLEAPQAQPSQTAAIEQQQNKQQHQYHQQQSVLLQKYSLSISETIANGRQDNNAPKIGSFFEHQTSDLSTTRTLPNQQPPVLGQVSSVLSISQVDRLDTGTFKCFAANHFGLDERTIQLVVQEAPERVDELSLLEVSSRSVTLGWLAPYDGNSPILNYHIQYRPQTTPSQILTNSNGPFKASQVIVNQQMSLEALNSLSWFNFTMAAGSHQQTSGSGSGDQDQLSKRNQVTPPTAATNGRSFVKISIGQLKPMNQYWFRLQAENKLGFGPISAILEGLTMEEAPGSAPPKLKASAQSSSSILVSWSKLSEKETFGSVNGYYVAYKPLLQANQTTTGEVNNSTTPTNEIDKLSDNQTANIYKTVQHDDKLAKFDALLSGLRRSTKYLISVQAYNSRGTGPGSEPIIVKTLEMDPPRQVKLYVKQASNCTIQLEWRPLSQAALLQSQQADKVTTANNPAPVAMPFYSDNSDNSADSANFGKQASESADVVDYYSLFQAELNERPRWQEVRLAGSSASHLVENLRCGTRYQFYMMGVNRIGVGDQSDILDTKTAGGLPLAPDRQSSLDVVNTTCYVIRLDHWQSNGCPIREFNVRFRPEQPAFPLSGNQQQNSARAEWIQLAHFNLLEVVEQQQAVQTVSEIVGDPISQLERIKRDALFDDRPGDLYLYPSSDLADSSPLSDHDFQADEDSLLEYSGTSGGESSFAGDYPADSELAQAERAADGERFKFAEDRSVELTEEQNSKLLNSLLKDSMLDTLNSSDDIAIKSVASSTRTERSSNNFDGENANLKTTTNGKQEWHSANFVESNGKKERHVEINWQRVKLCNLMENYYYTIQMTALNSVGETEAELRILTAPEGLEYSQEKRRQVIASQIGDSRMAASHTIFSERLSQAFWPLGNSDQNHFILTILLSLFIMGCVIGISLMKRVAKNQTAGGSHTSSSTSSTTTSSATSSGPSITAGSVAGTSSNHCQNYLNESHAGLASNMSSFRSPGGAPSAITEAATIGSEPPPMTGSSIGCNRYAIAAANGYNTMPSELMNQSSANLYQQHRSGAIFGRTEDEPAYGIVGPAGNNGNMFANFESNSINTPLNSNSPTNTTNHSSSSKSHHQMNGYQQQSLSATLGGRGRSVYLCSSSRNTNKDIADQQTLIKTSMEAPPTVFYQNNNNNNNNNIYGQQYELEAKDSLEGYLNNQHTFNQDLQDNNQLELEAKLDDRFMSIVEEVARANENLVASQQQQTSGKLEQCNQIDCQSSNYQHSECLASLLHESQKQELVAMANQQQQQNSRLLFDPVYASIRRTMPQAIRYLTLQQQHHNNNNNNNNNNNQHYLSRPVPNLDQQQMIQCNGSSQQQQQVDMNLLAQSANLAALKLLTAATSGGNASITATAVDGQQEIGNQT